MVPTVVKTFLEVAASSSFSFSRPSSFWQLLWPHFSQTPSSLAYHQKRNPSYPSNLSSALNAQLVLTSQLFSTWGCLEMVLAACGKEAATQNTLQRDYKRRRSARNGAATAKLQKRWEPSHSGTTVTNSSATEAICSGPISFKSSAKPTNNARSQIRLI